MTSRTSRSLSACLGACLLALTAAQAEAAAILWTLEDVEFDDGGLGSGSFVYDADTGTFSSIAITTTAVTPFGGGSYTTLLAGDSTAAALVTSGGPNLSGTPVLDLLFTGASLTNAGGYVPLVDPFDPFASSAEGLCVNATCTSASPVRMMISGALVGEPVTVVPLPAGALLFPSALGLLAWLRRTAAC